MDLLKARTVGQCIDLAIVDANGDDEVAVSWQSCLEEVLAGVSAELADQEVRLLGFEVIGGMVLAVCRWKKRKLCVTLGALDFSDLTPAQSVWRRAYLKWQKDGWGHFA